LVRGGLTAPSAPGTYLLTVGNVRATVVAPDATGDPWWALLPAAEGSNVPLQLEVVSAARAAIPTLSPGGATVLVVLLAGAAALALSRKR